MKNSSLHSPDMDNGNWETLNYYINIIIVGIYYVKVCYVKRNFWIKNYIAKIFIV